MKAGFLATLVGLIGNAFLCFIKMTVGLWTSSLALLSDGVNSLTDVISSVAIFVAVRVSSQEADEGHPFGHQRAEPIAGLMVAIFAGIAGFEILKESLLRLYSGGSPVIAGPWPFIVLGLSILIKWGMSRFFYQVGRTINSPAILAGSMESRVDILISSTALVAVAGAYYGFVWLDALGALVISGFIFRAGYRIARENIDYLMGRSPDAGFLRGLREQVLQVPGVKVIHELRAHYVGNYIHVEIQIGIDRRMSTEDSHELGEHVQAKIEELPAIHKAFVHINPV